MQGSTIAKQASNIAYAMNARFGISTDIAETASYQVLLDMLERKLSDVPIAIASKLETLFPVVDFEISIEIIKKGLHV